MREYFVHEQRGMDLSAARADVAFVERSVRLKTGSVEVVEYDWPSAGNYVWTCDSYYLEFPLARRPGAAWASYLDTGAPVTGRLGRIMFIPPGRTVQASCEAGKQRSLVCVFSADLFESILPPDVTWDAATLAKGLSLGGPEPEWLLLKIYKELKDEGFCSTFVMESLLGALAVAIIRGLGLERTSVEKRSGGLAPWRMRRIRERVETDLPPPDVKELAELCCMSVRHLTRAFKADTGQTVAQFIQNAIIERARVLLAETDQPINEIAHRLGFADSTCFSSAFRRVTGLRPSDIDGRSIGRAGRSRAVSASLNAREGPPPRIEHSALAREG